ncbi:hypothetical protein OHB93_11460 [Microbacterium sp. No. 7]|uniref:hypothetical protein n=1 Tax=Microbacterium sp. No. 7 TaxID=1714373 RepID=UPI000E26BFB6
MPRQRRPLTVFAVAAITLCAGALGLSGCAASADPDTAGLESELASVGGVNGAFVWTTHPNAPWVTRVQVMLFLDDPSDAGVVDAVRAAAPVLSADDAVADADAVALTFIDGQRGDYTARGEANRDVIGLAPEIASTLGVTDAGKRQLLVSPDELRALAGTE